MNSAVAGAVIAVVGEVVADAVLPPDGIEDGVARLTVHPGGGPANTALALARLGSTARFAGRLSTGALGRLCRDRLVPSGVDLSASLDVPEPATLAIARLSDTGAAEYEFYAEGTADWGWTETELGRLLDPDLGPMPAAVHTGSLALARQPSGSAICRLLAGVRARATTSIDPNLRTLLVPIGTYRAAIDGWATLADIVRLSSDDLAELWPDLDPERAATRLHAAGTALVVVTLGGDGVVASLRGDTVTLPGVPVDLVDTVGAGDSFQAGLLHHLGSAGMLGGRLEDLDLDTLTDALTFASRVAAITCSRPGADPPWAHELAASGL